MTPQHGTSERLSYATLHYYGVANPPQTEKMAAIPSETCATNCIILQVLGHFPPNTYSL